MANPGFNIGSRISYWGQVWTVVGSDEDERFQLESLVGKESASVSVHDLMADPTYRVLLPEAREILSEVLESADITRLPARVVDRAVRLARHLEEVKRGIPYLEDEEPPRNYKVRAAYRPGRTKTSRLEAKSRQLKGTELQYSARHLDRLLRDYEGLGLFGLLPKNELVRQVRERQVAIRYVEVLASQMAAEVKGPERGQSLILMATNRVIRANPEYADVEIPSLSTQKRLFDELKGRVYWRLGLRRYVQSAHDRPRPTYTPVAPILPGERTEVDTKVLNILVRDPLTGALARPYITALICVATRMILGLVVGFVEDHTVLPRVVLDAMTPKPPVLANEVRSHVNRLGVAPEILWELFPDLDPNFVFASGPLVKVAIIVIDQGKPFYNTQVKMMLDRVDIVCELARKATPTDKPHIERFFGTLNHFIKQLKGYSGINVSARGRAEKLRADDYLTIGEVETLIRAWIALDYHQTEHDSLLVPVGSGATQAVSPMEMYQLLIEQHGFVPPPLSASLRYLLMDVEPLTIQGDGIHLKGLYYNSPELDHVRRSRCPWTHDGDWLVHFDPMDCRYVYLLVPEADRRVWVEVPWVHAPPEMKFPFPMRAMEFMQLRRPVMATDGTVRDWVASREGRLGPEGMAERSMDFLEWASIYLSESTYLEESSKSQKASAVRALLDSIQGTSLQRLEQRYLSGSNESRSEDSEGVAPGEEALNPSDPPGAGTDYASLDQLAAWRLLSGQTEEGTPGDG